MTISVYVLTPGSLLHDPLVSSCVTNNPISKYKPRKSLVVYQESPHTDKFPKMSPKLVDDILLNGLDEGSTDSACAKLLIDLNL